jgi:hypothetical protein
MKIQLVAPTQIPIPNTVYAILAGTPPIVAAIAIDLQSAEAIVAMIGNGATYAESILVQG